MTSYLLKGGTIATFTKDNTPRAFAADVLVEGSTITQIGSNIAAPSGAEVVDCSGRWVVPGMIDTHRCVAFGGRFTCAALGASMLGRGDVPGDAMMFTLLSLLDMCG